ncbi:Ada metal-binding domain-containing protein [Niabella drilacis]|uniref:Ada metal-binding domain-containing protein n=1 Tax=Niabella drilacis (strain DSM 25811 / CCM 8410 / CCUG 62505 / LMG 26954 / E90) TaxID=1285928 RepID=UPI000B8A337F|nr:Ada metal-binding domain-containing protein [Niabella drilacis]
MIHHIELGVDPAGRRPYTRALIRKGHITLGGHKRYRIYGLLQCASGKRMMAENRVFFKDEAEALAHGYRPCGHCLPEAYKKWKAALFR